MPLSLLSGNLRGWATTRHDGDNAWEFRAPRYAALLRELSPHLVGFQEFAVGNLADLAPALPFHDHYLGDGAGRTVPVLWDRRRFELVDRGALWLNQWRDRGGAGWDARSERSMTWVELADRDAGRSLLLVNTHLDHVGEISRVRSAQLILDFVDDRPPDLPMIITADFNCSPYRPIPNTMFTPRPFGLFAEAGFMDAYRSATGVWPPPATFHDYLGEDYVPDRYGTWYIDWPLTRNLRVVSAQVLRHPPGSPPLSDHYPVHAVVAYT